MNKSIVNSIVVLNFNSSWIKTKEMTTEKNLTTVRKNDTSKFKNKSNFLDRKYSILFLVIIISKLPK